MCLWVYTGSISLWGVWYLRWKSNPKNECLQLKTSVFLKTLRMRKLVWPWRLRYCCEDYEAWRLFVFIVSFSLSWVIGNTVLLKGVEVKLRKSFQVKLISKSYTYPILSSEAIGNLIQFSQFLQWQRQRSSVLWGICSDWGVRNSPVRISYKWGTW